jgi:DNA-binding MarR family transcriptional regulator
MNKKESINELINLMFFTSTLIKEKVKSRQRDLQLSFVNMSMLKFVDKNESPTMTQIADYFDISAPSATSMVETLIKSNYLRRIPDVDDRRVTRVSLTKVGKDEFEKILESVREKIGEALSNLDDEDLKRLSEIMIELNKHLNE